MIRINSSTYIRQSKDQLSADVDGDTVLMGIGQGKYYGLDDIGSRVWRSLTQPRQVAALCQELAHDYEADPATIETDVIAFLIKLADQGLIEIQP